MVRSGAGRDILAGRKHAVNAQAVATRGSHRPFEPLVASVPHFTMSTIRTNRVAPEHLLVVGADGDSCATAQAYRRLGADVTMIVSGVLLPGEDRDLVAVVRDALVGEGIAIFESARLSSLALRRGRIEACFRRRTLLQSIEASHLLVASRTASRRRTGARQWGGSLVRVIHTAPVLAHAGLTEARMRRFSDAVRVMRGNCYGKELGGCHHIKATCATHGALLGVTIVGPRAFELLQPWILALDAGLGIDALCALPHVASWLGSPETSAPHPGKPPQFAVQRIDPPTARKSR